MSVHVIIRKGEFRDSVVLLNVSRKIQETAGVEEALVVMGTDNNKDILLELGLLTEEIKASTPEDLIVAVKAESEATGAKILDSLESFFVQEEGLSTSRNYASLDAAIEAAPGANLAIVSVPGEFAAREARKALSRGLHTLVFSDNVPLEAEIQLKEYGRQVNRLVMGPDCGVCNIDGAALALASIISQGQVGIVGASGSGIQEVSALLDRQGLGISQAIGTGGRDLHPAVEGATMLEGIRLLNEDASTAIIVLIGKAPAANVQERLIAAIRSCQKPVVACFLGSKPEPWEEAGAYFAPSMDAAAQIAASLFQGAEVGYSAFTLPAAEIKAQIEQARASLEPGQQYLRGLFGGGTFAGQAQHLLKDLLEPVYSNVPITGSHQLDNPRKSQGHSLVDLGDETFTRGRAHPVIDPLPYRLRILSEFEDTQTAVILLDVILGPATHPNPAGYLVDAILEARQASGRHPAVVASVCGTRRDPQDLFIQEEQLRAAGVIVLPSSAQAALAAGLIVAQLPVEAGMEHLSGWSRRISPDGKVQTSAGRAKSGKSPLLGGQLRVVNIGVGLLADALRTQNAQVVEVEWSPPAGGDPRAIQLINRWDALDPQLRARIDAANRQAYEAFVSGLPFWMDVRTAGEVIPGYHRYLITHAGPPRKFQDMEPNFANGVIGAVLVEGLAESRQGAIELLESGKIELSPAWNYNVPIAGMSAVSYSMPMMVAKDVTHGTMGFSPIMEGPSFEALRSGVYNDEVAANWKWLSNSLGPMLRQALQKAGGINLRNVIARSLLMGDENHSRESASTLILISELAPHLVTLDVSREELSRALDFLRSAERFSQNVLIAGAAAVLKAAGEIPYSTVVTGMGGNGNEMGVKISHSGSRMFTAPAPIITGRYLNPATKPEDTVPFAGDSCAVTVYGLGGCAAAASPAVTLLGGGTVQDALDRTREMWEITVGKNPNYAIPNLNFEGTPTAFDIVKILETGILPISHAGMIHRKGGMAGAGTARIPMECFLLAFEAFMDNLEAG